MLRRSFLQGILSLPFLSFLKPVPAEIVYIPKPVNRFWQRYFRRRVKSWRSLLGEPRLKDITPISKPTVYCFFKHHPVVPNFSRLGKEECDIIDSFAHYYVSENTSNRDDFVYLEWLATKDKVYPNKVSELHIKYVSS